MRYATESVHPILLPQNRPVNTVRPVSVASRNAGFQIASSSAKTSAASAPTAQSCLEILPAARRCFRRFPENTPAGDHLVKGWEPRPNARDEKPRRTNAREYAITSRGSTRRERPKCVGGKLAFQPTARPNRVRRFRPCRHCARAKANRLAPDQTKRRPIPPLAGNPSNLLIVPLCGC